MEQNNKLFETQISQTVTSIINDAGRSPFLFLGSGFSRRYALTENWDDLLRYLCSQISDNEFLYEQYSNEITESSKYGQNPAIAQLIDRDFTREILSQPKFEEFRNTHSDEIRNGASLIKIAIAEHLANVKAQSNLEEFKLFKGLSNKLSGIITTNYDILVDQTFNGFASYCGQDELLFNVSFNEAEIYHIHGSIDKPESLVLTSEDYDQFDKKQDYLAAKLLTIFLEYPIIFIGYSLQDPNIISILRSIANCLGKSRLSYLKNRFIFVSRGANEIGTHSISFEASGSIEMTKVSTNNFGVIYDAISNTKVTYSPRILRQLRKSIYEISNDLDPVSKIKVSGFDGLNGIPDDSQIVIGLGKLDGKHPGTRVSAEMVYLDVVLDDQYLEPNLMITEHIPFLIKSNSGGLPLYKYLSAYTPSAMDPRVKKYIEEKTSLADFRNKSLNDNAKNYRDKHKPLSVKKIIELEGKADAYKRLVYLNEDEINVSDLHEYLSSILQEDKMILNGNSELKRLIRMYDFMTNRRASLRSTNSRN